MIIVSIIYAVICFFSQTLLFKSNHKFLTLSPFLVILLVYLICLILPFIDVYMTEIGKNDGYSFYTFLSLSIAKTNTLGLLSLGVAWLIEKI